MLVNNELNEYTYMYFRAANLHSKNFSYRPDIAAPWERLGQKIQVSGKIGHLVNGNSLLSLFSDDISSSCNETLKWDDIISPFFDLNTCKTKFLPRSGFYENSLYPHPQTLLIINPFSWYTRFTTGQGGFFLIKIPKYGNLVLKFRY